MKRVATEVPITVTGEQEQVEEAVRRLERFANTLPAKLNVTVGIHIDWANQPIPGDERT